MVSFGIMNWIGLFEAETGKNKLEVKELNKLPLQSTIQSGDLPVSTISTKVRGENGALEYSKEEVGESRVALFFALVRNIPDERLLELLDDCLNEASLYPLKRSEIISDLFILAFQTRDCRGGKGERSIFYQLLIGLYNRYPHIVLAVLPLIAEFGYYKDYFNILAKINESSSFNRLQDSIIELVVDQLKIDEMALNRAIQAGEHPLQISISLCSKYAPREGHKFQRENKSLFKKLVMAMFPSADLDEEQAYNKAKRLYRKVISKLTQNIDVPEVKMCGKRYASIEFDRVPSVSMKKYRKAFANEKLGRREIPVDKYLTGDRSNDPDRIECRNNLLIAIRERKIKGKQNFPHEIVHSLMKTPTRGGFSVETEIFQLQWEAIRNEVVRTVAEKSSSLSPSTTSVNLGKLVPLVDVSGSMDGTPMEVAIALGILISEVNHPAFRDRFISFETKPTWVNLSEAKDIAEKVTIARRAPWGGSTNIARAFKLIADIVETNRLLESEIPDLIVFSDMQFDEALEDSEVTQLESITRRFTNLGKKVTGKPYKIPRIIFWNLRGDTKGFPGQSTSENVQMLSGFSPALFKHLVEGGETEKKKAKVTPYDTFRKVLDDDRYYKIKQIVSQYI